MTQKIRGIRLRGFRHPDPAALACLSSLEIACFDQPWSREELETYLGSGAIEAVLHSPGTLQESDAYALFQLLPGESELLRVGVLPAARRRGVGSGILHAALDRLEAGGRPVCHLEVRADNIGARRLYERLHFSIQGRRKAYYGDGEDAIRYLRDTRSGSG